MRVLADSKSFCRSVVLSLPIIVVLAGWESSRAADSTCLPFPLPFTLRLMYVPQPLEDSAVGCVPPLPCSEAQPPTIGEWPESLTQELKLTATPLDPIAGYHSLIIWEQDLDETVSAWNPGRVIETTDVIERSVGNTATYGLSGLKPGVRYQHRVAWCRLTGTAKTCNCFPEIGGFIDVNPTDGIADARPTAFPTIPLAVPAGLVERAEDQFRRPATDPKRNRATNASEGGDGLGAYSWNDDKGSPGFANIGNGAHIVVDGNGQSFAEVPWQAGHQWLVSAAPTLETHTVGEVEFLPHHTAAEPNPPSGSLCTAPCNYRVSAVTRLVPFGGSTYYYNAQVHYDPDWPGGGSTEPRARVQRGVGDSRSDVLSWPVITTPAYSASTETGCVIDGANAAATAANTVGLTNGGRILVRARVLDDENNKPVIFATIAWNWNGAGYDRRCTWKVTDSSIVFGHPLYKKSGGWGFIVQHYDARVEAFRGFSAIP